MVSNMINQLDQLIEIAIFIGKDMSDYDAERVGDMARQLSQCDLYELEDYAEGTLCTILRQISAEKGWM